jgi:hypothetical protein
MCGVEPGEEGCELVPCCENGHWLHEVCLSRYVDADTLACPMCRSTAMRGLRQTAGLPMECLERTPTSNYGAAIAVRVGMAEVSRAALGSSAATRRVNNVLAAVLAARL